MSGGLLFLLFMCPSLLDRKVTEDAFQVEHFGLDILYFEAVAIPAEAFTIMCISIERTKAAARPLDRQSGRSVLKKIGLIWIISFTMELPHILAWRYDETIPGVFKCSNVNDWQA